MEASSEQIETIRDCLTCLICRKLCTIPVKSLCCDDAKKFVSCMACVRDTLELNNEIRGSQTRFCSWVSCGCKIRTTCVKHGTRRTSRKKAGELYSIDPIMGVIRDTFGPSMCPRCNAEFVTTDELHRHISGRAAPSDSYPNCQESITKCELCSVRGKRRFIEGEHYFQEHQTSLCSICAENVSQNHMDAHIILHEDQLSETKTLFRLDRAAWKEARLNELPSEEEIKFDEELAAWKKAQLKNKLDEEFVVEESNPVSTIPTSC